MFRRAFSTAINSLVQLTGKSKLVTQQGATILPLALAGLLGTSVIAVPLLDRAISSAESANQASSVQGLNAEAAAWYAMWRLEHDPTIHDEFSGSPPTATFNFRGAEITIVGVEPPDNNGIILSMGVAPNTALPDDPTVVTYTLTVKNDDDQPHDITRVEADPAGSFDPEYVNSSTTGMTTVDPTTSGPRFIWTPVSPVTVGAFGAEVSMSWDMIVDESEGNYWMDGEVRVDGVGDIEGLTEANVLVTPPNDLIITSEVTPAQVEAGEFETFNYTITVENTGSSAQTIIEMKFWATKDLDIVDGTTTGITTDDPRRNADSFGNSNRWEWTWDGFSVPINPSEQLTLSFEAVGSLAPGTWFSEASLDTVESQANGQEVAATTSASAPIKSVRVYDIHVDYFGSILDIEALLDNNGVEALTWVES